MVLPHRLTIDVGMLATGQHLTVAQDLVLKSKKALGDKKREKERKLAKRLDKNHTLLELHPRAPNNFSSDKRIGNTSYLISFFDNINSIFFILYRNT